MDPITRDDVTAAAARIEGLVRRTPVITIEGEALGLDHEVVCKLELLQATGSFKARGASSLLTGVDVPPAGVVAASGGNFGAAIAWAARRLGVPATIFVPDTSSATKLERLRSFADRVEVVPGYYAQALEASRAHVAATGALLAHAYDQPEVVAGQGTCAVELDEQADLDTLLVAVGGGGLIGGIATWYAGRVRVVAVETERCPTLHAALAAGRPVDVAVGGIAADALGAARIGRLGLAAVQAHVAASLLVDDQAVIEAQRRLWAATRLVAEPAGAAGLAALTAGAYRPEPGERVGVVVCGANTDPSTVAG